MPKLQSLFLEGPLYSSPQGGVNGVAIQTIWMNLSTITSDSLALYTSFWTSAFYIKHYAWLLQFWKLHIKYLKSVSWNPGHTGPGIQLNNQTVLQWKYLQFILHTQKAITHILNTNQPFRFPWDTWQTERRRELSCSGIREIIRDLFIQSRSHSLGSVASPSSSSLTLQNKTES